jgi:hypothetical protein
MLCRAEDKPMPEQKVPAKAACAVAMTAATGAAVCAGICVLPFALPAVAIAGFSSMIALLAGALAWVTALAVAIVALRGARVQP